MLVELAMLMAASSCDINRAAMGLCGGCPNGSAAYAICATETGGATGSSNLPGSSNIGPKKPTPMKLCNYYVNGSIDQPTLGIISAWVPVGSRLCIGDEVVEYTPGPSRQERIDTEISDRFAASSNLPVAWWEPGDEIEYEELVRFFVDPKNKSVPGTLLGEAATIRFTATRIVWNFSDGGRGTSEAYSREFKKIGSYKAFATVQYRVDYKIGSANWVLSAATRELKSNVLDVLVVKYPRRTLLVG